MITDLLLLMSKGSFTPDALRCVAVPHRTALRRNTSGVNER